MRRILLAFIVSFALAASLSGQTPRGRGPALPTPAAPQATAPEETAVPSLAWYQARILQLEGQLSTVTMRLTICDSQTAYTASQQQQAGILAKRAAVEKDLGCKVDWNSPLDPAKSPCVMKDKK